MATVFFTKKNKDRKVSYLTKKVHVSLTVVENNFTTGGLAGTGVCMWGQGS